VADKVDLMVGVATPVAMQMQAATEDNKIPVVFSAVSDPVGAGLVESMEAPGANLTGTSDYLDTSAVMNLILAANPDATKIGLLYDQGQDSATSAIASAKEYLESKGISYVERTGTNTDEVTLAAQALVNDGVDAVFTPTDNTIMTAELAIYETFIDAGIPHYTGADSFALNGAFLGYGVDYANLGVETANMVADILLNGADPATTQVMTFNNGIATVNTETCEALGLDFATIESAFAPLCTQVNTITTAESFSDLQK
jgi:putative ABC transport system substrate-binding protein